MLDVSKEYLTLTSELDKFCAFSIKSIRTRDQTLIDNRPNQVLKLCIKPFSSTITPTC